VPIVAEADILVVRGKVRHVAKIMGFLHTNQIKIATAVSELARNIHRYAGKGEIHLKTVERPRRGLSIEAVDEGPGISNLDEIFSGAYRSRTGMGLGLCGCKKLMDTFAIESSPAQGTRDHMIMFL